MWHGGGEDGASWWHRLGFGAWPPPLPSVLQTLEMVVGITASVATALRWRSAPAPGSLGGSIHPPP